MARLTQSRRVSVGGRTFVCSPPTVGTVDAALDLFGVEIWGLARTAYHEEVEAEITVEAALPLFLGGPRAAAVLATCVTCDGADVEQILASSPDLQLDIARAVLSMCDVAAVSASLGLERATLRIPDGSDVATDPDEAPFVPSPFHTAIIAMARMHGCSPVEILAWPYALFAGALTLGDPRNHPAQERGAADPARSAAEFQVRAGSVGKVRA